MRKVWIASAMSLALVFAGSPANAQSADAEELFKEGRAALDRKDYPTACTKLAESNRLERAVGTLISLAQCEEAQNKLAAARQHWQEAADFADALQDRLNRGAAAREKFTELDKRVPRLTVKAAASAPPDMTVKRDDVQLTRASFGSALPVDPGKHVIVAIAENHEARSYEVDLAEAETKEIEVEPGALVPASSTQATVTPTETTNTVPTVPAADGSSSMKTVAYPLAGVGIVGLALGTVFGLNAASKWSTAKDECKPGACGPGSQAQDDRDSAASAGTVSTIAFVGGSVALAAGVVLWVLAPSSSSASLRVAPTVGGLSAAGAF